MSVLIKGMEMPKSCDVCRFSIGGFCYASGHVNIRANEERQTTNYCPIVPVPDHGDLIDAQEQMRLMQSCEYDTYDDYNRAFDMLDCAPTIVPADHIGDVNEMVTDKEGEG